MASTPWRGVSVGGWLLMEPGPSKDLFNSYKMEGGQEARCEWELMEVMRERGALAALDYHRESYTTRRDFELIRDMGLNSVRVPFGYWIVLGALGDDPYVGPAMHYLDRAVKWAEELGLQILLDLHGAPGGESSDAPCGRRQRPRGSWHWTHWRFEESLRALEIVATRYQGRKVVTGMAVCNEPSHEVPSDELCRFYIQAVETIRRCGMHQDDVAIVLPVFQRSLSGFVGKWRNVTGDSYANVCFEAHYYHCFENEWHGKTFAAHLRSVQDHAVELQQYPMVVGEWSLALGCGAQPAKYSYPEMLAMFAQAQLAAYGQASHGWFFWTWRDSHSMEWDWQQSFRKGLLEAPKAFELPLWDGTGEDPLEAALDFPCPEPRVFLGDTVFLRAFHGRYLDVEGSRARARFADKGEWQQFVLCSVGEPQRGKRSPLKDGDAVSLLAHTGSFVGVEDGRVSAMWPVADEPTVFVIKLANGTGDLHHRSRVYLQSRSTSLVLGANGHDEQGGEVKEWSDFGSWQRFAIEKLHRGGAKAVARKPLPRRRSIMDLSAAATPARRRSSIGTPAKEPARPRRSSASIISVVEPESGRCPRTSRGGTQLLAASRTAARRKDAPEAVLPLDLTSRFETPMLAPPTSRVRAQSKCQKPSQKKPTRCTSGYVAKGLLRGKGAAKSRVIKRAAKPLPKRGKVSGITSTPRKPRCGKAAGAQHKKRPLLAGQKSKVSKGGA